MSGSDKDDVIHTDHLNFVRLIKDSHTDVDIGVQLRHINSWSYFCWIFHLLADKQVKVCYTRGHVKVLSLPSLFNYEVDCLAVQAQTS